MIENIIIKKGIVENNIIENKEENIDKNKEESSEKSIEKENESNESSLSEVDNNINDNNNNSKDHPFDNFFEPEENINEIKEEVKSVNTHNIIEEEPKEEYISGIILEKENEEPFITILLRNLFDYYPLFTFWNKSIYTHLFINISFFAFNIVLIFGFNSLFYDENIIEKRIKHINRDSFTYSLSKENIKMILSLISSMIVMLILRAIILIPRLQNKKLFEFIDSHNERENIKKENEVLKGFFIRRFITCLIMLIFTVFLFYYIVVFCSLYKHTQLNWCFSGVWCLLIEWIILAPLYILIISIVEKRGRSQKISSYYMKQLFFF